MTLTPQKADQLLIGITLAPRKVNYFPQMIASLLQQLPCDYPVDRIHLFPDAGTPESQYATVLPGATVHRTETKLQYFRNWLRMSRELLRVKSQDHMQCQYILTTEDDVVYSPGALFAAMTAAEIYSTQMYTLYTSGKYEKLAKITKTHSGFADLRYDRLYGACAWFWPWERLSRALLTKTVNSWQHPAQVDICIGETMKLSHVPIGFAVPSLVEHIGEESAVGNNTGLTKIRKSIGTPHAAGT